MPIGIYDHGLLWCSHCQEKRAPNPPGNFCPECKYKMRTTPRTRIGKLKFKARMAMKNE